jgi:formylglycine-generating enzyme
MKLFFAFPAEPQRRTMEIMKKTGTKLGFILLTLCECVAALGQQPIIVSTRLSGPNLVLNGSNGLSGGTYSVLMSTNLTLPSKQWTPVATNVLSESGGFTLIVTNTLAQSGSQRFYSLELQSQPATTPDGMALIPAGAFTMGDTLDGLTNAIPTNIYVSAFYIETNLESYSQWQSVYSYATNHGFTFDSAGDGKATNHPVYGMDWYDAVKWCNARSQQAGLTAVYYTDVGLKQIYTNGDAEVVYPNWTASGYRLPTEAEWEKAARGGLSKLRFPWGDTISESQANYYGDTNAFSYDLGPNGISALFNNGAYPYTSPVGYFPANGYGLFDMAGNIDEWCWDWYGTPYGQPTTNNPTGPASGSLRVLRGGNWASLASYARCSDRYDYDPSLNNGNFGLRCARAP